MDWPCPSFRGRPTSPLDHRDKFIRRLHGPTQAESKRTVVMVHGIEFGLLFPSDPIPGPPRFPEKERDFEQGTAIIQRDPIQELLFQGRLRLSVNGDGQRSGSSIRLTDGGGPENG